MSLINNYFIHDTSEIIAGYDALNQLSKQPLNTIYNAKRFIGRRYLLIRLCFICLILSLSDPAVVQYAKEHSFKVVESTLSNYSKLGFEISSSGHVSNVITPEQVGFQVILDIYRSIILPYIPVIILGYII